MPCTNLTIESIDTLVITSITATKKGTGMPQQVEISIALSGSSTVKRYIVVSYSSGKNTPDKETWDVPVGVLRISKSMNFGVGNYTICATLV